MHTSCFCPVNVCTSLVSLSHFVFELVGHRVDGQTGVQELHCAYQDDLAMTLMWTYLLLQQAVWRQMVQQQRQQLQQAMFRGSCHHGTVCCLTLSSCSSSSCCRCCRCTVAEPLSGTTTTTTTTTTSDVQRKLPSWRSLLPDVDDIDTQTRRTVGDLVVVCSLVDRLPNLGGEL